MNEFDYVKKRVEAVEPQREIDCLRTIVLNISEYCQLACPVCPRYYGYKNQEKFMPLAVVSELRKQLSDIGFNGSISISGMGEPMFHEHLIDILTLLQPYDIRILTNGLVPRTDYRKISDLATIIVSVHDMNRNQEIKGNLKEAYRVIYRNHDTSSKECELIRTNRGGFLKENNVDGICSFPFYKTLIDIDGSYLRCADDWLRLTKKENVNIFTMPIDTYFCTYLRETKERLLFGNRTTEPCSRCSANGKLMGLDIVRWYKDNVYNRNTETNPECIG